VTAAILAWGGRLLLFAVGCVVTALGMARLARRGRERPAPIELPPAHLLAAALAMLLAPRLVRPLLPAAANPAHPWNLMPAAAALLAALAVLAVLSPRPRWFLPRDERPGFGYAIAAYLTAVPALLGLLLIWVELAESGSFSTRHEILAGFSALDPAAAAAAGFLAILGMPVLEEMVFRGWLFGGLAGDARTGPLAALAFSSLAFGLSHPRPMWLPASALGLLFGWTYWRTGDLRAPILLHVLHNTGVLLLLSRI
jgi:membrane protease YdiL (CAAX protease family)